ncbi:hypothetical protein BH11MYX1_BH11MYX1_06870 [soil metagenome]
MKAAESQPLIGLSLEERYTILREIGRGGMGVVYEAEHRDLGKRIAIKVMLDKYANDEEAVIRFKREALAASRIGNPHIIDVSHIGVAPDGRPFVVMELLDGEPLSRILAGTGPMQPWRAIHIMRQVLRAAGAAHIKGIIHRDLKPDNIFIVNRDDEHDFVKLLDFGISKMIDTAEMAAATKLTTTGVVMGTPLYMAPEQAMGAPAERGVDIYACGVILFEMLAGRPPFDEPNYNMLVAKLLTAVPPLLSDVRKGLPAALVNAVAKALEKDPDQRFANCESFAQALPVVAITQPELEQAVTLPPGSSVPPGMKHSAPGRAVVARSAPTQPRLSSRKLVGGFLAFAGAAAIAGAAVPLTRRDEAKPAPATAPLRSATAKPVIGTIGDLQVRTAPVSGATIKVDGKEVGSTPIQVSIEAGMHQLHAEMPGYATMDLDQLVTANERTTIVITMRPALAGTPTPAVHTTSHSDSGVGYARPKKPAVPKQPVEAQATEVVPVPVKKPPPPPPNTGGSMPNPYE